MSIKDKPDKACFPNIQTAMKENNLVEATNRFSIIAILRGRNCLSIAFILFLLTACCQSKPKSYPFQVSNKNINVGYRPISNNPDWNEFEILIENIGIDNVTDITILLNNLYYSPIDSLIVLDTFTYRKFNRDYLSKGNMGIFIFSMDVSNIGFFSDSFGNHPSPIEPIKSISIQYQSVEQNKLLCLKTF